MLGAEALPVRLLCDQALQLGDERVVASQSEPGIVEELVRPQPSFLQLRRFRLVDRLSREVGERFARPEIERALQILGCIGRSSRSERSRRRFDEALEPSEVELLGLELQPVAGPMPLDALGAEHLAEPVHVHLERRDGGPRGLGAPESVDDPVSRCDRVRVQEQEGQQGALLRRSQRERPFVPDDLDGSQDAELDPFDPLSQADAKWLLSARLDGAPDPNDRKEHYMIHAGDTIHNPVTGERIVFRQTSRETNGEAVVIETFVQPNGFVAAAHVHPSQE
jgi:hypothetical protein